MHEHVEQTAGQRMRPARERAGDRAWHAHRARSVPSYGRVGTHGRGMGHHGFTSLFTPFEGGTLVLEPELLLFALPSGGGGAASNGLSSLSQYGAPAPNGTGLEGSRGHVFDSLEPRREHPYSRGSHARTIGQASARWRHCAGARSVRVQLCDELRRPCYSRLIRPKIPGDSIWCAESLCPLSCSSLCWVPFQRRSLTTIRPQPTTTFWSPVSSGTVRSPS